MKSCKLTFYNQDYKNYKKSTSLGYSGYAYWTGGRKEVGTQEWKWFGFGKQDFTYTNWAIEEPSQNSTSDVILVYFYSNSGWYDVTRPGSGYGIRYVCENVQ
jgi:hypothetical protein